MESQESCPLEQMEIFLCSSELTVPRDAGCVWPSPRLVASEVALVGNCESWSVGVFLKHAIVSLLYSHTIYFLS